MVHLGSCPLQLHLLCYAALCVRAAVNLRCSACRVTVMVEGAGRRALRQHNTKDMAVVILVARRGIPGEGGSSTTTMRDGKEGR